MRKTNRVRSSRSNKRKTRRIKAGFETSWQNDPDVKRICTSKGYKANSFICRRRLEQDAIEKIKKNRKVETRPTVLRYFWF